MNRSPDRRFAKVCFIKGAFKKTEIVNIGVEMKDTPEYKCTCRDGTQLWKQNIPLKAEWTVLLRVRLPPDTEAGFAFLTLGAELGGLMVGAAEAVTEGGTLERAEVEVIIAAV